MNHIEKDGRAYRELLIEGYSPEEASRVLAIFLNARETSIPKREDFKKLLEHIPAANERRLSKWFFKQPYIITVRANLKNVLRIK